MVDRKGRLLASEALTRCHHCRRLGRIWREQQGECAYRYAATGKQRVGQQSDGGLNQILTALDPQHVCILQLQ